MGLSEYAYSVPEVPILIVKNPSLTVPVPIAPIILSPPPDDTGIPSGIPSNSAAFLLTVPAFLSEAIRGASKSYRFSSISEHSLLDHARFAGLKRAVPDASPASAT